MAVRNRTELDYIVFRFLSSTLRLRFKGKNCAAGVLVLLQVVTVTTDPLQSGVLQQRALNPKQRREVHGGGPQTLHPGP